MNRTLPTAAVLLAASWMLPTTASAAAPVSDVKIAWSDATHTKVRITWTESTPVANTVDLATWIDNPIGTTTAAQPDEVLVPVDRFPQTNADGKHYVTVSGPGGVTARSVDFDAYVYAPQQAALSFPSYDRLAWSLPGDTSVDGTPNDPLDVPANYTYRVETRFDDPEHYDAECTPLPTTTSPVPNGQLARPSTPISLSIHAQNEWGSSTYGTWDLIDLTSGVTIAAPATSPLGGSTTLTGQVKVSGLDVSGRPPSCTAYENAAALTPVIVHQRTSPTAPWTVVGSTRTDNTGRYSATFRNPGHREYRVVVAGQAVAGHTLFGGDSATKAVRATTRVVSAKFIQPVVDLGTQPQAYLWVDPAGSQQAALQFKNASGAWQGLTYKTLYAGRGLVAFPWNKRGATQFRWWVPATATADATYSEIFTLTVR
ncbi:hypothetical protein [Kribbella sp. NPDC051770]|uniref:hypothetical protein n=1 Tax=Kribbella sp. NPDC051770 TaxID=3155413 RepID=UPI00342AEF52